MNTKYKPRKLSCITTDHLHTLTHTFNDESKTVQDHKDYKTTNLNKLSINPVQEVYPKASSLSPSPNSPVNLLTSVQRAQEVVIPIDTFLVADSSSSPKPVSSEVKFSSPNTQHTVHESLSESKSEIVAELPSTNIPSTKSNDQELLLKSQTSANASPQESTEQELNTSRTSTSNASLELDWQQPCPGTTGGGHEWKDNTCVMCDTILPEANSPVTKLKVEEKKLESFKVEETEILKEEQEIRTQLVVENNKVASLKEKASLLQEEEKHIAADVKAQVELVEQLKQEVTQLQVADETCKEKEAESPEKDHALSQMSH